MEENAQFILVAEFHVVEGGVTIVTAVARMLSAVAAVVVARHEKPPVNDFKGWSLF